VAAGLGDPRRELTFSGSDKEFIHVDKHPASPFKDRVYFTPNWKPGDSLQSRNFSFRITVHFAESADAVPWTKPDEMPLEATEFLGSGWGQAMPLSS
jgi:hypothetical protein